MHSKLRYSAMYIICQALCCVCVCFCVCACVCVLVKHSATYDYAPWNSAAVRRVTSGDEVGEGVARGLNIFLKWHSHSCIWHISSMVDPSKNECEGTAIRWGRVKHGHWNFRSTLDLTERAYQICLWSISHCRTILMMNRQRQTTGRQVVPDRVADDRQPGI